MPDNVTIDNGDLTDFKVATDQVNADEHYERVKVDLGGDGVSSPLVRGQLAKASSIPVTLSSDEDIAALLTSIKTAVETIDNFISGNFGSVRIADGDSTVLADVFDLTNSNPMAVQVVDANGTAITSFSGSGGTSAADDADFVQGTTAATPIQGVYESTPTAITDGDMGVIGLDSSRRIRVSVDASTLDVAHDAVDGGNPVLTGMRARTSLPSAVASDDRARAIGDVFGRPLVAHIDPSMAVHKNKTYTSQQTGTTIWDPTAGKKIAVTSVVLGTYGTTAGRIIVWFGDNGDTSFTQDTDQVLIATSHAPSTTSKPGVVYCPPVPIYCTTADREIHVTSDAAISFDLTIEGYEF